MRKGAFNSRSGPAALLFLVLTTSPSTGFADSFKTAPMPSDIAIGRSSQDGPVYTTSGGMTLYTTVLDETPSGEPGCLDTLDETGTHHLGEKYVLSEAMKNLQKSCTQKWPPFRPSMDAKPVGKWTIKIRPDGTEQWAHDGHYVYTSTRDKIAGEVNGADSGIYGRWRTVRVPLGFPPGIRLTRTFEGLVLATEDDRIFFANPQTKDDPDRQDWIPVSAPLMAEPSGEWDVRLRRDGTRQWSFRGQPLFLPGNDMTHEKIRASGANWKPVIYQKNERAPVQFTMQYTLAGWIYADGNGKSLYVFSCADETPDRLYCDEPGDPAIYRSSICGSGEECAREWQPVQADADTSPVGEWRVGEVPHPPFADAAGAYGVNVPTVRAWTYRGRPVYTFAGDHSPGDINGQSIRYYGVSRFSLVKVLGDGRQDGERYFVDHAR